MVRQLVRRENVIRLWGSVVDSSDIGSLLTKVAKDLKTGELEEARIKLAVLGSIYDTAPGCAFFRSTAYNYYNYLGLRQAYDQQAGNRANSSSPDTTSHR